MPKNLGCYCSFSAGEPGVSLRYPDCQTFSVTTDCTAPTEQEEKTGIEKEAALKKTNPVKWGFCRLRHKSVGLTCLRFCDDRLGRFLF